MFRLFKIMCIMLFATCAGIDFLAGNTSGALGWATAAIMGHMLYQNEREYRG